VGDFPLESIICGWLSALIYAALLSREVTSVGFVGEQESHNSELDLLSSFGKGFFIRVVSLLSVNWKELGLERPKAKLINMPGDYIELSS
jgi:hypothetical protein